MKTSHRLALTSLAILATVPSLRAEFLVLRIRETTADQIWLWIAVFTVLFVVFTMKNSYSKGGRGR